MQRLCPLKEKAYCMKTRREDKCYVSPAKTEGLKISTVPYLQRILNKKHQENTDKKSI